jgi:hypothetical protein
MKWLRRDRKATTVTIQRKWDEELQRGKSVRISDKTSAEIPWPKPQNPFKDKPGLEFYHD